MAKTLVLVLYTGNFKINFTNRTLDKQVYRPLFTLNKPNTTIVFGELLKLQGEHVVVLEQVTNLHREFKLTEFEQTIFCYVKETNSDRTYSGYRMEFYNRDEKKYAVEVPNEEKTISLTPLDIYKEIDNRVVTDEIPLIQHISRPDLLLLETLVSRTTDFLVDKEIKESHKIFLRTYLAIIEEGLPFCVELKDGLTAIIPTPAMFVANLFDGLTKAGYLVEDSDWLMERFGILLNENSSRHSDKLSVIELDVLCELLIKLFTIITNYGNLSFHKERQIVEYTEYVRDRLSTNLGILPLVDTIRVVYVPAKNRFVDRTKERVVYTVNHKWTNHELLKNYLHDQLNVTNLSVTDLVIDIRTKQED